MHQFQSFFFNISFVTENSNSDARTHSPAHRHNAQRTESKISDKKYGMRAKILRPKRRVSFYFPFALMQLRLNCNILQPIVWLLKCFGCSRSGHPSTWTTLFPRNCISSAELMDHSVFCWRAQDYRFNFVYKIFKWNRRTRNKPNTHEIDIVKFNS